jgi:hypothetical protein
VPDLETREKIRRVRLGNVRTLLRHRCGYSLPEDDAGLEYLIEILKIESLGPDPGRRMFNAVEVFAPHMTRHDAISIICKVNRMPVWERWPKAKVLGESLRLTNAEREGLKLWAIAPCDITAEDLAEQRKRKERERKRRKRAEQGVRSRAEYLAKVRAPKPWEIEGIPRRTWFYRRKKEREGQRGPGVALGASA